MVATTTDTDALLVFAREHELGLWRMLVRQHRPTCVCDGNSYSALPAAEAHVALEAWLSQNGYAFGRGGHDPSFHLLWWVEGKPPKYGDGDTLVGAVLVMLEAK